MQMQGQRLLPVSQQEAWDALNDAAVLKSCIPGCTQFEGSVESGYDVGMALKIGPVSAKFTGKVSMSEMNPPASYKLAFEGQGGVAGFGSGQSVVRLVPLAPQGQGCELSYTVDAQVGGKIAQLGQRLIDGAAKSVADDFFKRFEAALQERYPNAFDAPIGSEIAINSAAACADSTAQNGENTIQNVLQILKRDFINPPWIYVWAGGVGAVAMAAVLFLASL